MSYNSSLKTFCNSLYRTSEKHLSGKRVIRPYGQLRLGHQPRGLLRIGCMLWSGLAAHPDQDYAVPLRLSLRRGNRLCFQGFYELVRA